MDWVEADKVMLSTGEAPLLNVETYAETDLEKAVELGIISQDELNWAIQNNVDFSALMLTAFERMNGDAAKALGEVQAADLDKRIQELNRLRRNVL